MTVKNRKGLLCLLFALLLLLGAGAALALLLHEKTDAGQEYDTEDAVTLSFSDSGIALRSGDAGSVEIDGTALRIQSAGTYILSGRCADGSVEVEKNVSGVTLVLSGLDLTSTITAPITCGKGSGVTIVAAQGTENALADSTTNNDDSFPENEAAENAVIKCKDGSAVTLCGTGALSITANGKNGIKSGASVEGSGDASLTIREITLNSSAPVNDAINTEQLLDIESGSLVIQAGDDAIHCDRILNIGTAQGEGPEIQVTGCYEGLEAAQLNIFSGTMDVLSTDDCLNTANSDLTNTSFSMNISGGSITACSSSGDGFDSNGTLTISGGTVIVWTVSTADNQPLDADGEISITGGTVLAAGGSAGMGMNLSAGQPYVIFGSSAAGGFDRPGSFGGDPEQTSAGGSGLSLTQGEAFTLSDENGSVLYSGQAACQASYLFFSSSQLSSGSSCTLSGSSSSSSATAGTDPISGSPGNLPGGFRPGETPENPGDFQPDENFRPGSAPSGEGQPPQTSRGRPDGNPPQPPQNSSSSPAGGSPT